MWCSDVAYTYSSISVKLKVGERPAAERDSWGPKQRAQLARAWVQARLLVKQVVLRQV